MNSCGLLIVSKLILYLASVQPTIVWRDLRKCQQRFRVTILQFCAVFEPMITNGLSAFERITEQFEGLSRLGSHKRRHWHEFWRIITNKQFKEYQQTI